jgi:hypothetical protein
MTTRVITNEAQRDALIAFIRSRPLPITVEVAKGKHRSVAQNRRQFRLLNEIAEQMDQTVEEVRAYCKLTIGIPIMCAASELFRKRYAEIIKPLPYEMKIALMSEPFDFEVTRKMNTKQKTQYLDEVCRVYSAQGVVFSEDQERAEANQRSRAA